MDMELPPDLEPIIQAASEFASYPGVVNDAAAKDFLDQYPLPVLLSMLQLKSDLPSLEDALVSCLDRIFRTRYGSSLLLQYVVFIQAGLQANSESIRCLACKSVSWIIENSENKGSAVKVLVEHSIYPLLINCLVAGNEKTSSAALNAIKNVAKSPEGIGIIFPYSSEEPMQLKSVASHCSSLARIRILALIKELFSISDNVASAIFGSNLLSLFEMEINERNDPLTVLSALEVLYELVQSPCSTKFLLNVSLLQLLTDAVSNNVVDPVLRSRAMLISGRLLSSSEPYRTIDESRIKALLLAIDGRLNLIQSQNSGEVESAIGALGLIGSSVEGASLLLTSSVVAKHVIESAFDRQSRGKQLVALHALGSIAGVDRPKESIVLNARAEEGFKRMIYETSANSSKLAPSVLPYLCLYQLYVMMPYLLTWLLHLGLFLSVLQQEPEVRLAAYRLISALVRRTWCLMEICSKPEITSIVIDANIEDTKIGMEARHQCCSAIYGALTTSNLVNDAKVAEMAGKLQEAAKRGPYLTKKRIETQPIVITADRF